MVKLLKYDFLSFRKYALPLGIVILTMGIISGALQCVIEILTPDFAYEVDLALSVALTAISSLSLIAYLATFVCAGILCVAVLYRFYGTMYTDEGYLTHVLPLSKGNLLFGKVLFGYLAVVGTGAAVVLSLVISHLIPLCVIGYNYYDLYFYGFGQESLPLEILAEFLNVVEMLLLILSMLLLAYLSITLGAARFRKHRIFAALITFFTVEAIVSIVSTIFELVLIPVLNVSDWYVVYELLFKATNILLYGGISVASYVMTYRIIDRSLNLD